MKKVLCLSLVVLMLMSVFAFGFSAAKVNDKAVTGADVIKFDNSVTNWAGPVMFYVYDPQGGTELIPWGSKKLNGTDEGNNIWSKDLSDYGLESDKQYCIIFADSFSGAQTYDLVFDTTCFGDTAKPTGNYVENPVDSNKVAQEAVWESGEFGPRLQITSIGNVVGSYNTKRSIDLFEDFLTNTLDNARTYSGKDDQTLIDDIASAIRLSASDVEYLISFTGVSTDWRADRSTLSGEPSGSDAGSDAGYGYVSTPDSAPVYSSTADTATRTGYAGYGYYYGDGNNSGNDGGDGNNSTTSPKTGHSNELYLVALLTLLAMVGVGVSIRKIAKKHD